MDFVTVYQFGLSSAYNLLQTYARPSNWFKLYHARKNWMFFVGEFSCIASACAHFGFRFIPQWVVKLTLDVEKWESCMCDAAEVAELQIDDEVHPMNVPIVYRQLKSQLLLEPKQPSSAFLSPDTDLHLHLTSELTDNTTTGHGTAAITLMYLFLRALSHREDIQVALGKKVRTLSPPVRVVSPRSEKLYPSHAFLSLKNLDALPLLHACLMETFHLHPAAPGPQPRSTPPDTTIGPYIHLPAGVRISTPAYSLHRNAAMFPQPALRSSWHRRRRRYVGFWTFSSGDSTSVGSTLGK